MWDLLQTVQGRSLILVSPFLFLCNVLMVSSLTCAGKVVSFLEEGFLSIPSETL